MIIGVLQEPGFESRVSILPEHIATLKKWKVDVLVESGAGRNVFASDELYTQAGASVASRGDVLDRSKIVLSINPLTNQDLGAFKGSAVLGTFQPLNQKDNLASWCSAGKTVFSMDMLPRTTRAQSMDVLSSQANIAGYKAVLLAAEKFPRYFPMFMTAAGTIPPAKMMILGAGVAGLQAIATARRLGAVVEVFDTRPAVKEEVMSLGAKFIEVEGAADASKAGGYAVEQSEDFIRRQKEKISESVAKADIVITTAQIPGKPAPVLITDDMLQKMKPGSVIIDLAAATGGNTSQTKNSETIVYNNVTIIGNSRLPGTMPVDASKLYGKNILNFLQLIIKDGELNLDFADDLVKGSCIIKDGEVIHPFLLPQPSTV